MAMDDARMCPGEPFRRASRLSIKPFAIFQLVTDISPPQFPSLDCALKSWSHGSPGKSVKCHRVGNNITVSCRRRRTPVATGSMLEETGALSVCITPGSVETIEKNPITVGVVPIGNGLEDVSISSAEWEAAEKSLVRKLDMTLMPMIWTLYMFNYLDRNNLGQAKLNRFEKDLGLVGDQFNTAVSIFNVGYMVAQLPSNMLLTRVRPSVYIPCCGLMWACVSASTASATSYSQLVAIRVMLGLVEAPFFPGILYILSCWYTQKELAFRTAVLYTGMLVATAFSGLIAAAVFSNLDGARGLAGWQWLFIIEGAGSFTVAIIAFFMLPDYVGSKTGVCSRVMTETELTVAAQRIKIDKVSVPREEITTVWRGVKLAVMDLRTWVFVFMLMFYTSCHGINSFYPTIVKGLHLGSNTVTLVLTAPPYLLAAAVALGLAYSSDRCHDRGLHIGASLCFSIVGYIITAATVNKPVRYFASFLYLPGTFAATGIICSWATSVLSDTLEKKAAGTAMVILLAQFGNLWSPYFFRPEDSPRYFPAFLLMMMFAILCIGIMLVMRWRLGVANKKIIADAAGTGRNVRLYLL